MKEKLTKLLHSKNNRFLMLRNEWKVKKIMRLHPLHSPNMPHAYK